MNSEKDVLGTITKNRDMGMASILGNMVIAIGKAAINTYCENNGGKKVFEDPYEGLKKKTNRGKR